MKTLTERQKTILILVVREYIDGGQAVGSKSLVKNYKLDISSATVRNEMRALTEMGFLRTRTGRIPTEAGYRYFIRQVMKNADLPNAVQRTISHQFSQTRTNPEEWMTLAASVLAHQTQAVSLVTAPRNEEVLFKHVELIATQGRQILMVLVFEGGDVAQQILMLAEPVTQEKLSQVAERLNKKLYSFSAEILFSLHSPADLLEKDIFLLIQDEMKKRKTGSSGEIYMDGMENILAEPSFAKSDQGKRALRFFDERSLLEDMLSSSAIDSDIGGVQVLLGNDEGLKECS
ncbi:MAG: heat-inducible transcription repressor HrcA, partial [Anaerolineae bacterium]|nr:heat-inducible transcription repressor HrcA [Anaerolineae bacterium]